MHLGLWLCWCRLREGGSPLIQAVDSLLPDVFFELVYLPFQGLLQVRVVDSVERLLARRALEEGLHRLLEGPRDARGRPAVVELARLLVVQPLLEPRQDLLL